MRLIDADALIEKLDEQIQMPTFMDCLSAINSAPSIAVVSVEDYRSMENTCYKLQKALYEMADAPTIQTKEVKYFDEDEKVWKIGSVIVDE